MNVQIKEGVILKGRVRAEVSDFKWAEAEEMAMNLLEEIRRVADSDNFEIKIDVFTKTKNGIGL